MSRLFACALSTTFLALAAAPAGAFAQPTQFQLDDLRAREEAAQRRAVDQANQLHALETRLRAEQAVRDLARPSPLVPAPDVPPRASAATAPALQDYPMIPDAALAESNRRVRAAARDPR